MTLLRFKVSLHFQLCFREKTSILELLVENNLIFEILYSDFKANKLYVGFNLSNTGRDKYHKSNFHLSYYKKIITNGRVCRN